MDFLTVSTLEKANKGQFLHLKHMSTDIPMHDGCDPVTGKGGDLSKPVGLYILGRDSDVFTARKHRITNESILKKDESKSDDSGKSELFDAETLDSLIELTAGWQFISIRGEDEFSAENVKELYRLCPWVKEQASIFATNRANFI